MTIKYIIAIILLMQSASSCKKNLEPYSSKSDETALNTPEDIQTATYGTYAGMVEREYNKNLNQLGEYPGDNIALSGATGDQVYYTYTYTQYPDQGNSTQFWQGAYKVINAANAIIERIKDGESATLDQLKGENLYLRAMAHFNLLRIFARPYTQNQGNDLGVVIKDTIGNELLPRSTVKEVYDFVIADLLKAASLMTISKNSTFASKEVAYALLSRVYLYMEQNDKAIEYADKVIQSGRYQLMATEPYRKYFTVVPENNPETIFAIRFTIADDPGKDGIGSMYYNDPVTQSTGWGEVYASQEFVDLLDQNPEDARHSFIEPQLDDNGQLKTRNGTPIYYINKYNWQEGIANLSSPVYLRLAEMYLNRAEANAKLGNDDEAIEDVNMIRERAGLSGSQLYTTSDLRGRGTVLNVVLEERRLELAFEAQRPYDLFRNHLPLVRDYPGFHGDDHFHQTIEATSNRVVHFIPEYEIRINKYLIQNP